MEKKNQKKAKGDKLSRAAQMIAEAEKPYIYFGGGAVSADVSEEITELADKIDAPVGCTMMGLSAVPVTHPRYLGMEGNAWTLCLQRIAGRSRFDYYCRRKIQ